MRTMARTMPAAAAKRGICHRESFDTNGIIADVACVFARKGGLVSEGTPLLQRLQVD
jgi:hypothetical protein